MRFESGQFDGKQSKYALDENMVKIVRMVVLFDFFLIE
jgi:hypothetical protein